MNFLTYLRDLEKSQDIALESVLSLATNLEMDGYRFIPYPSREAASSDPARRTIRGHVMRDFLQKKELGQDLVAQSVRESSEHTVRSRDRLQGRFRLPSNPHRTRQDVSERTDGASRLLGYIGMGRLDPFYTTDAAVTECADKLLAFCR